MTEPTDVGDMFDYQVPEVIWRPNYSPETGELVGYVVDPPFSEDWDHLISLRHYAALIEHRTSLEVRVAQVGGEDEPEYHVLTGHATGGPAPYEVTWSWLSGFELVVQELLWKASKDAQGAAE